MTGDLEPRNGCRSCSTKLACLVAFPRPCGRPPVSLVSGAIDRGVVDAGGAGISEAYGRYLERLADLGAAAGEGPTVQD